MEMENGDTASGRGSGSEVGGTNGSGSRAERGEEEELQQLELEDLRRYLDVVLSPRTDDDDDEPNSTKRLVWTSPSPAASSSRLQTEDV